jgi:hypothetical protein
MFLVLQNNGSLGTGDSSPMNTSMVFPTNLDLITPGAIQEDETPITCKKPRTLY